MKILNLPLKAKWYDMIESGEKRKRDSTVMEKPRTFLLLLFTLESVCREARRLFSLPFSLSCPYHWSGNGKKQRKSRLEHLFFQTKPKTANYTNYICLQ